MKFSSGYVYLKNVRFHAFHGVLPQEGRVGGEFLLSLRVGYPLSAAIESDAVSSTVNYAELYAIAEKEMSEPSKLLEHVAGRIADAIERAFPEVVSIDLELTKLNPPMGADADGAGVEIHWKN